LDPNPTLKDSPTKKVCEIIFLNQGCGSGLDPDSETLWIRIRTGNPDPDPDPGARKLRNFSGKMHFSYFYTKFLPLKSYKLLKTHCKTHKN
jgi:hypothetical protein